MKKLFLFSVVALPGGRRRAAAVVAAWAIAALGVAWLAGPAFGQSVTVQQVEAFENPPTNTHYAPVNFNGSATATDPANFPGVAFHAQANTTDTFGSQAFSVGQQFYASGTVGQPFITNAYNNTNLNFINGLNTQGTQGAGQPLPAGFGNGIRVSNHSYVADFGNATADENAVRRIDYLINNQDVVFVASAVAGGAFANQNLVWSARNSLAVRGDSASTPFDPSAAANTITSGKRRADAWSDGNANPASGRVSGYVAALIGQATLLGLTDATHNQVVRSLVMTGADPSAVGSTTGTWMRSTPNNLSTTLGAGRANYSESLNILQGGERTLQPVTGGATPNVSSNSLRGFAYGTSTTGQQAIVINAPNGISQLSATLNWNVTQVTTGGVLINTSDAGRIFPNLALELRTATLSGGQFVLGLPALPQAGLSSNATGDNVERLYFNALTDGGGTLPPGTYAFLISGDPSQTTTIGFSYDIFVPIRITSITRNIDGHIILQCLGFPNQVNNLQVSPDLSAGSFMTISPLPPAADNTGAFQYDDAAAVGLTKRFYRLAFP